MRIVPATLEDLEAIQDLHDQLDLPGEDQYWAKEPIILNRIIYGRLHTAKNGQLYGAMGLQPQHNFLQIETLAVDCSSKRKGIGRMLVDHAMQMTKELRKPELRVASRFEYGAKEFYLKCGFSLERTNDFTDTYEFSMRV